MGTVDLLSFVLVLFFACHSNSYCILAYCNQNDTDRFRKLWYIRSVLVLSTKVTNYLLNCLCFGLVQEREKCK
jgi:hypothetical protein